MKKNVYIKPVHSQGEEAKFDIGEVERQLKPMIIDIVGEAFRKYSKAHGAKPDVEDLEWNRFKRILNRLL